MIKQNQKILHIGLLREFQLQTIFLINPHKNINHNRYNRSHLLQKPFYFTTRKLNLSILLKFMLEIFGNKKNQPSLHFILNLLSTVSYNKLQGIKNKKL